ncbi:hypothetical protein D9757_014770 [Collybiopsis confluens]|uniref:Reverse transcriptase domain-containing protein n=1 Tax=Collybiopsis confluens TaxID=2823264 RepID=A0A8H5FZA2_9AGAR|nr:hypothetical protein D9757_014770 [Collybiopsis confluens]
MVVGVVSKKHNSSKLRLINHLSWPHDSSVNDGIADSEASIGYDMFEKAVRDLIASGRGSLLAKFDLKDTFRHIPLRAADWHLFGISWGCKFYYSLVLTFGLKNAPYIFNLFAEALHWIIQRHIPANLCHYLDDFLLIFSPNFDPSRANAAIEWVMLLGAELGLNFQLSKTVWPTRVIPHSRIFLRRLFNFEAKLSSPFSRRHIPSGVHSDLAWWRVFSVHWNGVRILSPSASVSVWTDASGVKGIGGVIGDAWFGTRVPRRFRTRDIQFKELFAVLHAILCWGNCWSGKHVVFYGDNQAVVQWLVTGTCNSVLALPLLRVISMMAASLYFSFTSVWIPSAENALADAASCFQYSRLFELAPHLPRTSSSTQSHLNGIRRTLTSLHKSRSISSMELHPKTIKSYLSSVCSLHVDAGLPFDVCESPTVQRLICGIKQYYGEKARNPKLPVTAALMDKLASFRYVSFGRDEANFDAAYKLAWSGFLRCGEFTVGDKEIFNPAVHLTRACIQFLPSIEAPTHIRLTLPESKTNPFQKGVSIIVAAVPHSRFCAVTVLKHLFVAHPLPLDSPLFSMVDGRSMTRSFFISTLKSRLLSIGVDPAGYSGHSFRRGAATSAAAASYSDYEIQLLGRWRSDAYKLYLDVPVGRLLHLSARLHVAAAAQAQLPEPLALHFALGAVA